MAKELIQFEKMDVSVEGCDAYLETLRKECNGLMIKLGFQDYLKFFQGHFVFQRDTVGYFHGRPHGRPVARGAFGGNATPTFIPPNFCVLKNFQ